jgi:hypothetical protein
MEIGNLAGEFGDILIFLGKKEHPVDCVLSILLRYLKHLEQREEMRPLPCAEFVDDLAVTHDDKLLNRLLRRPFHFGTFRRESAGAPLLFGKRLTAGPVPGARRTADQETKGGDGIN